VLHRGKVRGIGEIIGRIQAHIRERGHYLLRNSGVGIRT
jgi:hypothetical protein